VREFLLPVHYVGFALGVLLWMLAAIVSLLAIMVLGTLAWAASRLKDGIADLIGAALQIVYRMRP